MSSSWLELLSNHPAVADLSAAAGQGPARGPPPGTPAARPPLPPAAASPWARPPAPAARDGSLLLADLSAISLDQSLLSAVSVSGLGHAAALGPDASAADIELSPPPPHIPGPRARCLVAHADGMLFICSTSSPPVVRAIGLRDWKKAAAAYARSAEAAAAASADGNDDAAEAAKAEALHKLYDGAAWKDLVLPGVDFAVNQIALGPTGRLLALAGDHAVAVAVLPLTIKSAVRTLECKTLRVGEAHHALPGISRIVKVMWHPLSESGTHLMVLSSTAKLWMFDVAANSRMPEQTIDLATDNPDDPESKYRPTNRRVFGPQTDENEAVSFCMGMSRAYDGDGGSGSGDVSHTAGGSSSSSSSSSSSGSEGWAVLTLYALMRNGDVVSLCPLVPSTFRLPLRLLLDIKRGTDLEWSESDATDATVQSRFYWRSKWIQELLDQVPPEMLEDLTIGGVGVGAAGSGAYVVCQKPLGLAKLSLARRGPFLVQPSAPSSDVDSACDICFVHTPVAPVLAIASDTGLVNLCLEIEPPTPKWHIGESHKMAAKAAQGGASGPSESHEELPVLALLETIDLGLSKSEAAQAPDACVSLLPDGKYPDVLYAHHAQGVHSITVEMLDSLQALLAGSSAEGFDACPSSVRHVVTLGVTPAAHKTVAGFVVLAETYLGYSYLLLTSENQLFGDSLPLRAPLLPGGRLGVARGAALGSKTVTATAMANAGTAAGGAAGAPAAAVAPFKSVLAEQPYQMPKIFQSGFPRRPRIVGTSAGGGFSASGGGSAGRAQALGYPMFINTETMPKAVEHAAVVREDLQALYNAKGEMLEHLDRQALENKQHVTVLADSLARVEAIDGRVRAAGERIERLRARRDRLAAKCDLVLQILVDHTQPALSPAEIKWRDDLVVLRKQLTYDLKPAVVETALRTKEVARRTEADEAQEALMAAQRRRTAEMLGSGQIARIRESLKVEYTVLSDAARKVEALEAEMRALR
ncbi:hypothetical protein HK105_200945 [Polyrhizophydium stewartii]|uniref:Nuclear pore complex protein Nup88 n=1 Tax=Polyrhizophydium stewartii TaxID=2732419 RepID=A0ABR4NIG6_9FUNG